MHEGDSRANRHRSTRSNPEKPSKLPEGTGYQKKKVEPLSLPIFDESSFDFKNVSSDINLYEGRRQNLILPKMVKVYSQH